MFEDNCEIVHEDGSPSSTCAGTGPYIALLTLILIILWGIGICGYSCFYRMFRGYHKYESTVPYSSRAMGTVKEYVAPEEIADYEA